MVHGITQSQSIVNYFIGDESNWNTNVPTYDAVGLGDVAKTFDTLSDVIDEIGDFIRQPPPEEQPDNVPAEQRDLTGMLDTLKENLDQSRIDPTSHSNPEQATQINNLLDKIAQKIAEIKNSIN